MGVQRVQPAVLGCSRGAARGGAAGAAARAERLRLLAHPAPRSLRDASRPTHGAAALRARGLPPVHRDRGAAAGPPAPRRLADTEHRLLPRPLRPVRELAVRSMISTALRAL